jgi:hypothetical protein
LVERAGVIAGSTNPAENFIPRSERSRCVEEVGVVSFVSFVIFVAVVTSGMWENEGSVGEIKD